MDRAATPGDPTRDFVERLGAALADGRFVKLLLGRPLGADAAAERVMVRRVETSAGAALAFVHRHPTRDVTKTCGVAEGIAAIAAMLGADYGHAHLLTTGEDVQWSLTRKGRPTLRSGKLAAPPPREGAAHDRVKRRHVDLGRPFLAALGVTDGEGRLVPAMARKWKQIDKFVEIFEDAIDASPLAAATRIRVADFGSGKGYLTFAVHDFLRSRGIAAEVVGYELRDDLVRLCEDAARRLALDGLGFEHGDVRSVAPQALDVMIALHACDTATDHAIHRGIVAGASVILCAPCCHKELRPQLKAPAPLAPLLRHGVHLGQEAEMLTDGLRALLLDAHGYDAQVFEFVSLEHTSKNKMVLAVRRPAPPQRRDAALAQVRELKDFYGIREQCLATLLGVR